MLPHLLASLRSYLFPALNVAAPPIIVGATGGSGTRTLQPILKAADVYTGTNNQYSDAMFIQMFLNRGINQTLRHTRSLDYSLSALPNEMVEALKKELSYITREHFRGRLTPGARWGWKHPRNMYVLPYIKALFPEFRFIHMIRDGRDIAFSPNQMQPLRHYESLFNEPYEKDSPIAGMRQWSKANLDVLGWCDREHKAFSYVLRFEDLCAKPEEEILKLYSFLGFTPPANLASVIATIRTPESSGRWKNEDKALLTRLEAIGREGLTRFGYL